MYICTPLAGLPVSSRQRPEPAPTVVPVETPRLSSYEYGCAVAEKSDEPIGTRTQLMPMPWLGLNSAFIRFVCAVALSLSDSSQAEVSVIAAPKPTMLWNVWVLSTLIVPEPDEAEKPRSGCCARCWLRSEVVSHFCTTSLAAEAGDAATTIRPSVPARAPSRPARRIVLDIYVKPLG